MGPIKGWSQWALWGLLLLSEDDRVWPEEGSELWFKGFQIEREDKLPDLYKLLETKPAKQG